MTSFERRDAVPAGVGEEGLSRPFWGVVGRKAAGSLPNFASSVFGNRPPHCEDGGRYLLWFSGELENAGALRKRANVESLPVSPADEGGQERLFLSVWQTLGKEGLSLFSGAFAFALVDLEEGLVYLGSDPFGHQTLYYAPTPDGLFFATKILLILKNSDIKRRANPDLLYIYLRWGLIPAPGETFFRGIYRVPPGFVYVARIDHPENGRLERFISPPLEEPEGLSFQEAKVRVRELFFRWLLDLAPWVSSLLKEVDEERFPFFRRNALLSEWERIRREKVLFDFRVWRWINVILWARTFDVIFE